MGGMNIGYKADTLKKRGYFMPKPPIRTITLGIEEAHPLSSARLYERQRTLLQRANSRFEEEGYEVQTVRISTRPVFD